MTVTEIYVQARMGSTRLPGKVLKEVLGKPLLEYQIERLTRSKKASAVVVLTSQLPQDDAIVDLCKKVKIPFFRGSEQDVLDRYYQAAQRRSPDIIVRITADNPLIDPQVIDHVISQYKTDLDYVSNTLKRTYPKGMEVEVFSKKALDEVFHKTVLRYDREHVTPFFYHHPEQFRLKNVEYHKDLSHESFTVDTEQDFQKIKNILENLYPSQPQFTLEDILTFF